MITLSREKMMSHMLHILKNTYFRDTVYVVAARIDFVALIILCLQDFFVNLMMEATSCFQIQRVLFSAAAGNSKTDYDRNLICSVIVVNKGFWVHCFRVI